MRYPPQYNQQYDWNLVQQPVQGFQPYRLGFESQPAYVTNFQGSRQGNNYANNPYYNSYYPNVSILIYLRKKWK